MVIGYNILSASESDDTQNALATKLTPYYSEAKPGLLPRGYIKKGDTCAIRNVHVDTAGIPWFSFKIKTETVWSPAKYWIYISEIDTAAYVQGKKSEEEKRRRLRILRDHRDWPRRIIRAIRFGRICLDMSIEQLRASWDEPFQKSSAFTIGLGTHSVWIYKGQKGNILAVLLKNEKVIGWTER